MQVRLWYGDEEYIISLDDLPIASFQVGFFTEEEIITIAGILATRLQAELAIEF